MRIAFLGLGRMGSAMAGNLLKAGHEVTVFNRTRDKSDALAKAGAKVADSAGRAVRDCEIAFTMLADDAAVSAVALGEDGIASSLPAGAAHVSMSTIGVATSKKLAHEHGLLKQAFVAAPVFGRPEAAEAKRLLVVVAGETGVVQRIRGLLDAVGRHTYVAGANRGRPTLLS
jgi:3-hydroxyisobutyrate dehydrogenase-like beta-hydroxyacid dehydrogenase